MKRKAYLLLLFVLLTFIILPIYSGAVKVVSWNVLNFPGSTGAAREVYFRMVINKLNPDVLVVQGMLSQTGVNQFLNRVMNYTYPGRYAAAGFTDGPDTDNAMFYKRSTIAYSTRTQIATDLKDISVYKVKVISGLGLNTEFRICSVHLKSGPYPSDKVQREYEAKLLRKYLNRLSSTSLFLVCGNFNSYSSSDSAFAELTESQIDNDGRCKDPINELGPWHDNFTFAKYHSQSSRATAFGGGASGGLDDRFDLILVPYVDKSNLVFKSGSYKAYGNDGRHLNKSVNSGTNSAVGTAIANALYKASDHLPIVIELVPPPPPHAKFVLVSYTKSIEWGNTPVINGIVRNDGNATGENASITWTAYNSDNTIIDTAWDYIADGEKIPAGISATFEAYFFDLSSWSQVAKLTKEIEWLDVETGQIMKQRQELW